MKDQEGGGVVPAAAAPRGPMGLALLGDALSGLGASLAVAPFVLSVDKAIIQNASGSDTLPNSLRKTLGELFSRPQALFRRPELYMIWGVYSSTYMIANAIDTYCERTGNDSTIPKFLGATATNMGMGMAKDRALAQMFGTTAARAMPWASFGGFFIRDAVTIYASFNMPDTLSAKLQEEKESGGALAMGLDKTTAGILAQLTLPMAIQVISTPPHIAGLDMYNNPGRTLGARVSFVASQYPGATLARMGRILPAFGIGGLGNKYLRNKFRALL